MPRTHGFRQRETLRQEGVQERACNRCSKPFLPQSGYNHTCPECKVRDERNANHRRRIAVRGIRR